MTANPKPELTPMEQAWEEYSKLGTRSSPEMIFYNGWISRGFYDLERIHATAVAELAAKFDSKTHE